MDNFPSFGKYNGRYVHSQLAVGPVPYPHDISDLVNSGIRGVFNVMGVCGRNKINYVATLPEPIAWEQFGFWDGWRQDKQHVDETLSPGFAKYLIERTSIFVRDNNPVLIHCSGGQSRSGNLTAIIFAALENITPEIAIKKMQQFKPDISDFNFKSWWTTVNVDELILISRKIIYGNKAG